MEEEKKERELCLKACANCITAGYKGACRLEKDHKGEHKCNKASGKEHTWEEF